LLAQRSKLCFLFGQQAKKLAPLRIVLLCGQLLSKVLNIEAGNEFVHDTTAQSLLNPISVPLDCGIFK
jgi:hypothetical protein